MVNPERWRHRHVTVVRNLDNDGPWGAGPGFKREVELETSGVTRIAGSKEVKDILARGRQLEPTLDRVVHEHPHPWLRIE
jgi:hypothetical protein